MSFSFVPALRRNTHILIGIGGPSGSGKTYTALELATGLAGEGGKIAAIDTEAGRALHYADKFKFDHCDLTPPFTPARYREAVEAAEQAGYSVIVVDSMSHEHAGEGGLLEWAEEELKKPNIKSPANWAVPKAAHKRMMNRFLQCRSHLIFCLRAEEKIKIERIQDDRTGNLKTVVVPMGWTAICEKTFMFEMVVSFVMSPEQPGVPIEGSGKIQDQHRFAFPEGQRVSRESGRLLSEWAAGGVLVPAIAPASATHVSVIDGDTKAKEGSAALAEWWQSIGRENRKTLADYLPGWKTEASRIDKLTVQDEPSGGLALLDEISGHLVKAESAGDVDSVADQYAVRLNEIPHEEWLACQAAIDARRLELEGVPVAGQTSLV